MENMFGNFESILQMYVEVVKYLVHLYLVAIVNSYFLFLHMKETLKFKITHCQSCFFFFLLNLVMDSLCNS